LLKICTLFLAEWENARNEYPKIRSILYGPRKSCCALGASGLIKTGYLPTPIHDDQEACAQAHACRHLMALAASG
jgi:hypothetical protein